MPGRLVGQTEDENGKRGFVLTLQAREQHIRRDKATSNICSNQALNALAASVAMTALGKKGVKEIAWQNLQKAAYAKEAAKRAGLEVVFDGPMFNEFVVRLNEPVEKANERLLEKNIIGGYDLGASYRDLKQHMLIAVTELRTREEIDTFMNELGDRHE